MLQVIVGVAFGIGALVAVLKLPAKVLDKDWRGVLEALFIAACLAFNAWWWGANRIGAVEQNGCYVDWDGRSNPTVCD